MNDLITTYSQVEQVCTELPDTYVSGDTVWYSFVAGVVVGILLTVNLAVIIFKKKGPNEHSF